eukprot:8746134-Lingulodinium_polyedra.AAC.1
MAASSTLSAASPSGPACGGAGLRHRAGSAGPSGAAAPMRSASHSFAVASNVARAAPASR